MFVRPLLRALAGLAVTCAFVAPCAANPRDNKTVDEAIEVLRVEHQFRQFTDSIVRNVRENPDIVKLGRDKVDSMMAHYAHVFDSKRLVDRVRTALATRASANDLEAVIHGAKEPLAQRAIDLEVVAGTATAETINSYAADAIKAADHAVRTKALRRLDAAIGASEMWVAVSVAGALGTTQMLADASEPQGRVERDRIWSLSPKLAAVMRPALREQIEKSWLFVYRDLSAAELDDYVAMHERPAIRRVMGILTEAFGATLIEMQQEVAAAMIADMHGKGDRRT